MRLFITCCVINMLKNKAFYTYFLYLSQVESYNSKNFKNKYKARFKYATEIIDTISWI